MRLAVLADVHANEAAFDAVLAAARGFAPDLTLLLGDIVGYNASPRECIARAREACDVVVRGNHDHDAASDTVSPGTHSGARLVQDWTRRVLDDDAKAYLSGLPRRWDHAGISAVHGCYLNDTHYTGYVTSTMLPKNLDAIETVTGAPAIGLCGHTHVPMLGWKQGDSYTELHPRGATDWPHDASAVLINPGAVGQPRDRDPRAAFAVVDVDRCRLEIVRVEYAIDDAAGAIVRERLPSCMADRLREGR